MKVNSILLLLLLLSTLHSSLAVLNFAGFYMNRFTSALPVFSSWEVGYTQSHVKITRLYTVLIFFQLYVFWFIVCVSIEGVTKLYVKWVLGCLLHNHSGFYFGTLQQPSSNSYFFVLGSLSLLNSGLSPEHTNLSLFIKNSFFLLELYWIPHSTFFTVFHSNISLLLAALCRGRPFSLKK